MASRAHAGVTPARYEPRLLLAHGVSLGNRKYHYDMFTKSRQYQRKDLAAASPMTGQKVQIAIIASVVAQAQEEESQLGIPGKQLFESANRII